jgi:hypothetical protein
VLSLRGSRLTALVRKLSQLRRMEKPKCSHLMKSMSLNLRSPKHFIASMTTQARGEWLNLAPNCCFQT